MKGGKRVIAAVAAGLLLWSYFLFALLMRAEKSRPPSFEYAQLQENIDRLERLVALEKVEIERVRKKAEVEAKENEQILRDLAGRGRAEAAAQLKPGDVNAFGPWKQPIAVLVFACNRPLAVRNHLDLLIKYRPSAELFPIIVSQDCDNQEVADAVKSYGNQVRYIKHLSGEKANITVSPAHLRYIAYYRIARHYKLALSHVFDTANYGSVIVTEDDLSVAVDFFEYFSATRHLLELDQSLYCVSAWNDNGKKEAIDMSVAGSRLLYRSDFFPGLGWMMTKRLWTELGPIWPAGFWDDWIRDPLRRKDRGCIRPEISRTGMTKHGKSGASKGLFFSKHLARVELNQHYVNFTQIDLQYLLQENYDPWFQKEVYESSLLSINEVFTADLAGKAEKCRVEYISLQSYMIFADRLHAGVGRTAYQGVVSCFVGGRRIYLARDRRVITNYDPAWEAPAVPGE